MNRTISLIIDDPMPHHHSYYIGYPDRVTQKGEALVNKIVTPMFDDVHANSHLTDRASFEWFASYTEAWTRIRAFGGPRAKEAAVQNDR